MKILFKNAKIVSSKKIETKDVFVKNGVIEKIASSLNVKADKEYDLTGKYLMPGVIDAHVHFRCPGYEKKEDWESGSSAALSGGVTTVFDMPNTKPHTTTVEALEQKRDIARAHSKVNFGFFFGAEPANLEQVKKARGIVGVKVFMAETTGHMIMEKEVRLEKLLEALFTDNQYIIAVHAENEDMFKRRVEVYKDEHKPEIHSLIRSDAIALEAAKTAVHLAKKFNGRLHLCHVSTKKEMELLVKFHGKNVTCEAAPHHLFLSVSDYMKQENFVKINPPLRSIKDQKALWGGIKLEIVDMIASDHAPHLKAEKRKDYWEAPAGVPGVETSLPLMLNAVNDDMLELKDVCALMCENPADIFGLAGKGYIREGFDADLVVVDMNMEKPVENRKLYTKCGWSPYAGRVLKGWPVMTFVNGIVGMVNGRVVIEKVIGREVVIER
ncbi:dihydroorotase [Candidatus Peregrinibacteria bacterium]|nr:dihydroorotase [Candidatus Peregrinibacteria bacterium]